MELNYSTENCLRKLQHLNFYLSLWPFQVSQLQGVPVLITWSSRLEPQLGSALLALFFSAAVGRKITAHFPEYKDSLLSNSSL